VEGEVPCNCLEKIRLKVEGELDILRGEFRKKEAELVAPLVSKYSQLKNSFDEYKLGNERRVKDLEEYMLMQERTIGCLIQTLSQIQGFDLSMIH